MPLFFALTIGAQKTSPEREVGQMRHKVTINIADHGKTSTVLHGANLTLPTKLVKFLFGGFTQVYLLAPGQTVESVDIREVQEGGTKQWEK